MNKAEELGCTNDYDLMTQDAFGPSDTIFVLGKPNNYDRFTQEEFEPDSKANFARNKYCFEISSLFRIIFGSIYPFIPTEKLKPVSIKNPFTNEIISEEDIYRLNREYSRYWFRKNLEFFQAMLDEDSVVALLARYKLFDILDDMKIRPGKKIKYAGIQPVVSERYIDKVISSELIKDNDDWLDVALGFAATGLKKYIKCLEFFPEFNDIAKRKIMITGLMSGNTEAITLIYKIYNTDVPYEFSRYNDDVLKQLSEIIISAREINFMDYMLEHHNNQIIQEGKLAYYISSRYINHGDVKKAGRYSDLKSSLFLNSVDPDYKEAYELYLSYYNQSLTDEQKGKCMDLAIETNKYGLIYHLSKMGALIDKDMFVNLLEKGTDNLSSLFYFIGMNEASDKYRIFFSGAYQAKNYLACALLSTLEELSTEIKSYRLLHLTETKNYDVMRYCVSNGADHNVIFFKGILTDDKKLMDFARSLGEIDANIWLAWAFLTSADLSEDQKKKIIKYIFDNNPNVNNSEVIKNVLTLYRNVLSVRNVDKELLRLRLSNLSYLIFSRNHSRLSKSDFIIFGTDQLRVNFQ